MVRRDVELLEPTRRTRGQRDHCCGGSRPAAPRRRVGHDVRAELGRAVRRRRDDRIVDERVVATASRPARRCRDQPAPDVALELLPLAVVVPVDDAVAGRMHRPGERGAGGQWCHPRAHVAQIEVAEPDIGRQLTGADAPGQHLEVGAVAGGELPRVVDGQVHRAGRPRRVGRRAHRQAETGVAPGGERRHEAGRVRSVRPQPAGAEQPGRERRRVSGERGRDAVVERRRDLHVRPGPRVHEIRQVGDADPRRAAPPAASRRS